MFGHVDKRYLSRCWVKAIMKRYITIPVINRFFINVLCSNMFKEAFIATVQVQSTFKRHERSQSNEAGSTCQSCIKREL